MENSIHSSKEKQSKKSKGEEQIMGKVVEISYVDADQNTEYEKLIEQVLNKCFKEEEIL